MAHVLIFDSGVGGLSVVGAIRQRLPELRLSYVADDIFRPYGEKSESALQERLTELLAVLEDMIQPDAIIIACNTASTTALDSIRATVSVPVIGVVPAIKPAAEISHTKVIGVLGTPGTVRRRYVDGLINRFAANCEVRLQGSSELVRLAEDKLSGRAVDMDVLKHEIAPLFSDVTNMDAIVLACTHFPLLKAELQAVSPYLVTWVDSGDAIARRLVTVLEDMPENTCESIQPDMAFLMDRECNSERRKAFETYGFQHVIPLMA